MQNYTNNANGGVPSTIKMGGIFNFFEFSVHTFFWEEKENWSVIFFVKNVFILRW